MNLRATGEVGSHSSCYLNSTNACSSKISGEHLVSHGVLKVLAEKEIELSGTPWLQGQKKRLGFAALTANCLCTAHNSALSAIDTSGAKFFSAIQKCGTTTTGPTYNFLLSGHDIERWLLRTLAAMGVSKNLAIDGAALDDQFIQRLHVPDLLEDPGQWKQPAGLYLMQGLNHQFLQREDIQLAPLLMSSTEIVGMTCNVQGLNLGLLADGKRNVSSTPLASAVYRPGSFNFKMLQLTHTIDISWDDNLPHASMALTWKP